jgi:hypothetical protein
LDIQFIKVQNNTMKNSKKYKGIIIKIFENKGKTKYDFPWMWIWTYGAVSVTSVAKSSIDAFNNAKNTFDNFLAGNCL